MVWTALAREAKDLEAEREIVAFITFILIRFENKTKEQEIRTSR
jgi:hypothetical protein